MDEPIETEMMVNEHERKAPPATSRATPMKFVRVPIHMPFMFPRIFPSLLLSNLNDDNDMK